MIHMPIISEPMLNKLGGLARAQMHLVLPHLYDTHPKYVEYYRKCRAMSHVVMQDNSIFELKEVVAGDLIDFGRRIQASEIVIPEVLRDAEASAAAADEFFKSEAFMEARDEFGWVGVVQGRRYIDIVDHYNYLMDQPDIAIIAFPFNFEFDGYDRSSLAEGMWEGWNRFSLIYRLASEGVLEKNAKHHLLGLFNPAELFFYQKYLPAFYPSIRSNDSSSCFWHALYGVRFIESRGMPYRKIKEHVNFFAQYTTKEQEKAFLHNLKLLRGYIIGGIVPTDIVKQYRSWAKNCDVELEPI